MPSSEAERAFRNAEIYVEKLIERPRHIEIQVLGDRHGNMVYLGERECSIQRRHQKVMEECPSPLVAPHPEMRRAMGEAAVRAARAAGYYNAGTVEFLVDQDRRFYFLEMNTRLQVEHPVTELVTGLDLVRLQIEIAAGERAAASPRNRSRGAAAAIECRIYAEDPYNNFLPSPGKLTRLTRPLGPGIRLDGCVYEGWTVPMEYDPLLAKLAVWAGTREEAIARMIRALREYDVGGIRTNIGFFRQILEDPEFRAGRLHTGFIDEFFARDAPPEPSSGDLRAVAALAAALHTLARSGKRRRRSIAAPAEPLAAMPAEASCCDETGAHHRRARRASTSRSSRPRPTAASAWTTAPERAAHVETPEPGVYSVLLDGRVLRRPRGGNARRRAGGGGGRATASRSKCATRAACAAASRRARRRRRSHRDARPCPAKWCACWPPWATRSKPARACWWWKR